MLTSNEQQRLLVPIVDLKHAVFCQKAHLTYSALTEAETVHWTTILYVLYTAVCKDSAI